jgi:hypothetical protein
MLIDVGGLRDLLADPRGGEAYSAVLGTPVLAVEVPDGAAAASLAPLATGAAAKALACVLVLVVPDPEVFAGAGHVPLLLGDVLLTDDPAAPRPFVAPGDGAAAGLAVLAEVAGKNPVAATSLALLLRSAEGLDVPSGLIAESATYSALQANAEFLAWRASRPLKDAEEAVDRVLIERTGDLLTITMNRPSRRNALDAPMRDALADAFGLAAADPGVRVEFRGAGKDFGAGGDLDEFGSRPDPGLAHLTRLTRSPARLLHSVATRTTAYLHGACLGAGVELPSFAGTVVATPDASLGLPEVSLGLIPGAGGTVSLPRRIGRQRTAWIGLSGRRLTASEALAWGLVDAVTD